PPRGGARRLAALRDGRDVQTQRPPAVPSTARGEGPQREASESDPGWSSPAISSLGPAPASVLLASSSAAGSAAGSGSEWADSPSDSSSLATSSLARSSSAAVSSSAATSGPPEENGEAMRAFTAESSPSPSRPRSSSR